MQNYTIIWKKDRKRRQAATDAGQKIEHKNVIISIRNNKTLNIFSHGDGYIIL